MYNIHKIEYIDRAVRKGLTDLINFPLNEVSMYCWSWKNLYTKHYELFFNVGEWGWHRWHADQYEIPSIFSKAKKIDWNRLQAQESQGINFPSDGGVLCTRLFSLELWKEIYLGHKLYLTSYYFGWIKFSLHCQRMNRIVFLIFHYELCLCREYLVITKDVLDPR